MVADKEMKQKFSFDIDKNSFTLTKLSEKLESFKQEINRRSNKGWVFETWEVEKYMNGLGVEVFMASSEDLLKSSKNVGVELNKLESVDNLHQCKDWKKCENFSGHCMKFDSDAEGNCFNMKEAPVKVKVVREYTKTEDELREFIKEVLKKNPEMKLTIMKMQVARTFKNIDVERRVEIMKEEMNLE